MNADGSRGGRRLDDRRREGGVRAPGERSAFSPVGTIAARVGGLLIFLGARLERDADEPPPGAGPPVVATRSQSGEAEPGHGRDQSRIPSRSKGGWIRSSSRWLWLVKWLLAIPHFLVLFFLWIAFAVMTVVAFFAILITARYPRGIFDFNLGVLRWTWRVAFYTYSALGTDRYPPFSLGPEPDYPATLDVAYPERLSRGLVLVKWWLLAIPQYLVVGVFNGTWGFSRWGWGDWGDGGDWGWPVLGGG